MTTQATAQPERPNVYRRVRCDQCGGTDIKPTGSRQVSPDIMARWYQCRACNVDGKPYSFKVTIV